MQQSATTTATVSDLSHKPAEVLDTVESKDVLITRRDAEDVLVSTVTRVSAERNSIAALIAVVQKTWRRTQSGLIPVMEGMYPWMASLPRADQKTFVHRYADVLAECAAHRDFQPLVILLSQWEYTASLHRDEKLMSALLAPIVTDGVTGERALMPDEIAEAPAMRPRSSARTRAAKTAARTATSRR